MGWGNVTVSAFGLLMVIIIFSVLSFSVAWRVGFLEGKYRALDAMRPVAFRLLRKCSDGEWKDDGRRWLAAPAPQDLVDDVEKRSEGWRIEYAYAAGAAGGE